MNCMQVRVAFVLCLLPVWSTTSKGSTSIKLKDVGREALEHARGLQSSKASLAAADAKLKSVRAGGRPTLELGSTLGYQDQRPRVESSSDLGSPRWKSSVGLEVNWNIWDGGKLSVQEQSSRFDLKRTEIEGLLKSHEILRDSASKFIELYQALNAVKNHEEKTTLLLRQKETIERKVKNGLAPEVNLVEIEGMLQKHTARGIAVNRTLKNARSGLAVVIGSESIGNTGIEHCEMLELTNLKLPRRFTYQDTLAAKVDELQDDVDKLKIREIDLEHGPQIALGAGVNLGSSDFVGTGNSLEENRQLQSSINLSLKQRLWDWGQREQQKEALLSTQKATELKRQQSKAESKFRIDDLFAAAESLAAQKSASLKLLEIEKKRFDVIEQNYRRGTQSYLELITALDGLSSAKQDLDDVLVAEQQNFVQLHFYAGDIYDVVMAP